MGPKRRHPIIIDYDGQRSPRKGANKRVTASEAAFRLAHDKHRRARRRRTVWVAASVFPIAALWLLVPSEAPSAPGSYETETMTVSAGSADSVLASTRAQALNPATQAGEAAAIKSEPIAPPVLAPHKAHHDEPTSPDSGKSDAATEQGPQAGHGAPASSVHAADDGEQANVAENHSDKPAAVNEPSSTHIDSPISKTADLEPALPAQVSTVAPETDVAEAAPEAPKPSDSPTPSAQARQRRVLIVGIDGFRADSFPYVFIPTLQGLRRRGAAHMEGHTNQPTHSGPGWATLLTGQDVATHGVKDNRFKDLSTFQSQRTIFHDYKDRYPHARMAAFVGWRPIRSHLLKDVPVDVTDSGADPDIAKKAAALLAEDKDLGLLFVHLDAVDQVGHKYGYHYRKKTYRGAITRADTRLGYIIKALEAREDKDDWLVIVTTDHGGSVNGSHGQDRPANKRIFAIIAGNGYPAGSTLAKPPSLRDIAPTVRGFIGGQASASPGIVMTALKQTASKDPVAAPGTTTAASGP